MGFLPVGHTHEDIDQVVSCISRYLQRHSVLTIPGKINVQAFPCTSGSSTGLVEAVTSSFKEKPHVIELDTVVNAKRWMQDVTPVLHDHLKAHQFKFERSGSGECRLFYKEWSSDAYWLPDTGLILLPTGEL